MRLPYLLSATALSLSLCLPASATTFAFGATLSNVGEPNPTSTGTGFASVDFDDVLMKVSVNETFANLVNPASAAHIHCCTTTAFTGSSNVALGLASFPSAQSGNYVNTFTLTAAAFNSLLVGSQAGKAYLNIHSAAYPGGEIRGFLVPVPEPETYALMMAGLGLVGLAARRRRAA